MIDCCQVGGRSRHESANPLRSPGRSYAQTAGKLPMFNLDPVSNFPQGCEAYYSSTPTPATLHNFRQKQIDPTIRNGIAIKGIGRSIHTAYHFAANLRNAELDRIPSVATLHSAFPDKLEDLRILPSPQETDAFLKILDRVDSRFLRSRNYSAAAQENTGRRCRSQRASSTGRSRASSACRSPRRSAPRSPPVCRRVAATRQPHLWEQMAYATKIVTNDLARSVAWSSTRRPARDPHRERSPRPGQAISYRWRLIRPSGRGHLRAHLSRCTAPRRRSPARDRTATVERTVILAGG